MPDIMERHGVIKVWIQLKKKPIEVKCKYVLVYANNLSKVIFSFVY